MIPDYRIKGQPVTRAKIAAAQPLDRAAFVVVPDDVVQIGTRDPLETRDKMIAHLRSTGENYADARQHADSAARTHDRRSR